MKNNPGRGGSKYRASGTVKYLLNIRMVKKPYVAWGSSQRDKWEKILIEFCNRTFIVLRKREILQEYSEQRITSSEFVLK